MQGTGREGQGVGLSAPMTPLSQTCRTIRVAPR